MVDLTKIKEGDMLLEQSGRVFKVTSLIVGCREIIINELYYRPNGEFFGSTERDIIKVLAE